CPPRRAQPARRMAGSPGSGTGALPMSELLAIGSPPPGFAAAAFAGSSYTLADVLKRTAVALIFYPGHITQRTTRQLSAVRHPIARAFGAAGARLVLADVNAAALAERVKEFAAQQIEWGAAAGDLASPAGAKAAVAAAKAKFGGLDVVVNVAGGLVYVGDFLALTPEVVDKELTINVKTTLCVSQAAIPALLARGGGAIVNFAS